MRIGIDGGCLGNRRGFGRFARQSLRAMSRGGHRHDLVVFIDRPSAGSVEIPEGVEAVVVDVGEAPSVAASSAGRRSLGDMLAMGRAASRGRLDLMFFPASYSFFPVWNVGRVVVTMHDMMAMTRPDLIFPTWQGRLAWTIKEHLAARSADLIYTVSESSRSDILDWFKLPGDRVMLVTEGPDDIFRRRPNGPETAATLRRYGVDPDRRFFLYVGGLSPHKNLPRLIEAFGRSNLVDRGFQLVLVGDKGDVFHTQVPEILATIDRFMPGDHVVLTGFVPDGDLVDLYNQAEALVQPSLAEGFGLPPVEALACGIPVLSSTSGSLPEIIGNAGIYFDPMDVEAIASTLRRVVEEPGLRDRLAREAGDRVGKFTWDASARAMIEGFERLESRPKSWLRRGKSA